MQLSRDDAGNQKCCACSQTADQHRLEGATQRRRPCKTALDITEDSQRDERSDNRNGQCSACRLKNNVWKKRNETAGNIGAGDCSCTAECAPGIGLLKPQLKAHHKVNPGLGPFPKGIHDGLALRRRQAVGFKNLSDFYISCTLFTVVGFGLMFGDSLYGGPYYDTQDIGNALKAECLLAFEMNGAPLPVVYGAPLRLRVENQLGYKMVKWIERIEFIESEKLLGKGEGGSNEDDEYFDLLPTI